MNKEEKEAIDFFEKSFNKKYPPYWYDDTISNIEEKIKTILNLIQKQDKIILKEKEKNKELEEYANWHIEHLTEDIADYIDDDKKGNANIIGEFKEEREHWKDIIRIINNEKTYIDYKNY